MRIGSTTAWVCIAALNAGVAAAADPAGDLLDRVLDQPAAAKSPATQPARAGSQPAGAATRPAANRLTAEEQALLQQLEDAMLGKALLAGEEGASDMARVLQLMDLARRQLSEKFDPGKVTQAVQKKIVLDLDGLIEQAKKNQGQGGGSGQNQPQPGGKREKGQGEQQGQPQQGQADGQQQGEAQQGNQAMQESALTRGQSQLGQGRDVDNTERRREWGALPAREREEVIQGGSDQPLEKYRDLIDRYYDALNREE